MKFSTWLHEFPENEEIPRSRLISRLFLRVIKPMLYKAGYYFCYSESQMLNKFATWLHVIETEHYYDTAHNLIVPRALHRDEQIDRDNWYLTFNDDVWYRMSHDEQWNNLLRSRVALQYFWTVLSLVLYRYIDVENSPKCKEYDAVEAALEEEEYNYMVEQGLIVEKKRGNDDIVDKPQGKYYD